MKTALYLIGWSDGHPLKIGMTGNLNKRLSGLQTSCPYRLRVFGTRWYPSRSVAKLAEALMHSGLKHKRLEGEWFDVTIKEASEAANSALGVREKLGGGSCLKLDKSKVPAISSDDNMTDYRKRKLELRALRDG